MESIQARWLSINDAATYSKIGLKRLVELAENPQSPAKGFKDPDSKMHAWIFDRLSLDAYREGQFNHDHVMIRDKAKNILMRAGVLK